MASSVRQQALDAALQSTGQFIVWQASGADELTLAGAVETLTGRPVRDFERLGDLLAIVHPEDRARLAARCGQDSTRPDVFVVRFRLMRPDGHAVPCEGSIASYPVDPAVPAERGYVLTVRRLPAIDALGESLRLAELIEYLPDYVSIHATDGCCLSMNASGRRLLGLGRDEDVGRLGFTDIVADGTSAPAHLLLSEVMANGSHSSDVVLIHRRDDSRIPAAWSASVVSDASSVGRYIVCIARDVSEQLEIEWRLRQNQRRLTHALDVSRLGEWSMDIRTQSGRQSRRVSEIFGHAPGASATWSYSTFLAHIHRDDRDRVERAFARALESGADLDFEARIVRRDGELRWISARAGINRGLGGEEQHIGGVIQDITTRKFSEQRDRFFADVSVPLSALDDGLQTLEQVARLAVPFLADHCCVDLLMPDGKLARVVATEASLAAGIADADTADADDGALPDLIADLFERGRPMTLDVPEPERLDRLARTRTERRALRALRVGSYLGIPLVLRERRLGVLHCYRAGGDARYTARDRQIGQELGARVSTALENVRLYRALQDNDARKDEFLAMLSHELRNPLESLSMGVSLMGSDVGTTEVDWARTMMRGQIARLSSILEDLLDVSRYTFNKVVLQRRTTALAPLVAASVEEIRRQAETRGYRITVDVGDTGVQADIDVTRFAQVIGNLLTNAVKYGERRGTIRVTLAEADGSALVTIADDGIGLLPEALASVFELFSQVEATIDRSHGGLGMGLTLVRHIVEMHDGSVTAHSDGPDRGTRFVVRMPAADVGAVPASVPVPVPAPASTVAANGPVHPVKVLTADTAAGTTEDAPVDPADHPAFGAAADAANDTTADKTADTTARAANDAASGSDTTVTTPSASESGTRRLMLVDDNVETVAALRRLFSMKGYEVRTAHDGLEALKLAEDFQPHAAVLDIGLPGASGFEVASALRERYAERPLLLVALSGYGQEEDRARAREAGFDHHLLKPANFRTIATLLTDEPISDQA